MSGVKPIKVWGQSGPNPPKVAMVLGELGLPYEVDPYPISDVKKPEYLAINPNGRLPSIYDPNTDLTLWESGAIILYLIERYDTEQKLSFAPGTEESYLTKQWLFLQASGQGPYYGQAVWFKKFHPESVPSALERYVKEINRISGVLEGHLEKQKQATNKEPWLVGDKCTYADIAFIMWQAVTAKVLSNDEYNPDDYPLVKQWMDRMTVRPAVKAVLDASERSRH